MVSTVRCAVGLAGILYDYKVMLLCYLHYSLHVTGLTVEVDGEEGGDPRSRLRSRARLAFEKLLDLFGVYVEGVFLYVSKDGPGAGEEN